MRVRYRTRHLIAAMLIVALASPFLPTAGRQLLSVYHSLADAETQSGVQSGQKMTQVKRNFEDAIKEIEESGGFERQMDQVHIGYPPDWKDISSE